VEVTVTRSPAELIDAVRAELAALSAARPRQIGPGGVIDAEVIPMPDSTEETTA